MTQKRKKRHHYIPECYLTGFIDPTTKGKIWQFDKQTLKWHALLPGYLAVRKNLYRLTRPDGTTDSNALEDAFCQTEGDFGALVRKLTISPTLRESDMRTFLQFLALMKTRVPAFVEGILKPMKEMHKLSLAMLAAHQEAFNSEWEEMKKQLVHRVKSK